ncbi:MAG: ABC transporter, partial [Actinomycetota bacterium]|nr:ABC transporter [Actinomycetota bacterium]
MTAARVGGCVLALLGTTALAAPLLAPYDPNARTGTPFARPSAAHLLGTNDVGHDLLSELIYGARISLLIGIVAALVATLLGLAVGVVAGYARGW